MVAVATDDKEALYEGSLGVRSLATASPMTLDTAFWYASMTKALVATGAMQLVERGQVALDEPISASLFRGWPSPPVLEGYDDEGAPIFGRHSARSRSAIL